MRFGRWRAGTLFAVYLAIGLHVAHWKISGRTLAPLELNEVMYTLELGVVTAGFLFMAALVLGTLIFGRFFCSWACHVLALQDLCAWLLQRVGIRPRPIRVRILRAVPVIAMLYMFVWPQIKRLTAAWWPSAGSIVGTPPEFQWRVLGDASGWASFLTTDFTRNLPGPWIAVTTFLVCGFLVVYVLGSRSFCAYACPYGAVFALADRFAPGKIILAGECTACGLCTAACQSRVRVHEEVLRFGKVVDSSCLKDLDCVNVCPTKGLRWGFATPSLVKRARGTVRVRRPRDLSLREEIGLGVLFFGSFCILRGLYGTVPFLLALGASATASFVGVLVARVMRRRAAHLGGRELLRLGRVTGTGRVFLAAAGLLGVFLVHSGFIRYHELQSRNCFRAVQREDPRLPQSSVLRDRLEHHLRIRERWGLVKPPQLVQQLAAFYLHLGPAESAERYLREMIAHDPADADARSRLEWLMAQPELIVRDAENPARGDRGSRFETPAGASIK